MSKPTQADLNKLAKRLLSDKVPLVSIRLLTNGAGFFIATLMMILVNEKVCRTPPLRSL